MKVIGTWEYHVAEQRRFRVVDYNNDKIILDDRERGRCHSILLENQEDRGNYMRMTDSQWWELIILKSQL